eukprot:6485797-Amphidinium_carterae.2
MHSSSCNVLGRGGAPATPETDATRTLRSGLSAARSDVVAARIDDRETNQSPATIAWAVESNSTHWQLKRQQDQGCGADRVVTPMHLGHYTRWARRTLARVSTN